MLPMRPMTPAHASIASLSVVFPDDAWPTIAKFRSSPAEGVTITEIGFCFKHASDWPRVQAQVSGSSQGRCTCPILCQSLPRVEGFVRFFPTHRLFYPQYPTINFPPLRPPCRAVASREGGSTQQPPARLGPTP